MGLAFALGFVLVEAGNEALRARAPLLVRAGVPPVPPADGGWASPRAVSCAALFYALTLGLGLSGLVLPLERLWRSRFPSRRGRRFFGAAWAGVLLVSLNGQGVRLWETLYALGTSGWIGFRLRGAAGEGKPEPRAAVFPVAAGMAALLVTACMHTGLTDFKALRDQLLLGNAPGGAVVSFYYRYTLMAAEPLKSPLQKTQPVGLADREAFTPLEWTRLSDAFDACGAILLDGSRALGAAVQPEWFLERKGDRLRLEGGASGKAVEVSAARIFRRRDVRRLLERPGDHEMLRWWIRLSLFAGIPLGAVALGVELLGGLFAGRAWSPPSMRWILLNAGIWGMAGCLLLLQFLRPFPSKPEVLARMALEAGAWNRARAARKLAESPIRPAVDRHLLLRLIASPDPRVRYWGALCARGGEGKAVLRALIRNLSDPVLPVAAAAVQALARFHHPETHEALCRLFCIRHEWYVLDRTYRVLRRLGWGRLVRTRSGTTACQRGIP